ncbi:MAG: hypothetical protein C5B54_02185 [Acidobacteria bacterium]|nr:MAG: hypothetical protein C5B54_02185 [Acidobacteriota bacterium]
MPSPVGHTLGAYAALVTLDPRWVQDRKRNLVALGLAFTFGTMADADFIVAEYSNNPALHHHFFTHSIPFAVGLMLVTILLLKLFRVRRPLWYGFMLGVAYGTHLLLDYFAQDGSTPVGIPLLWPFTIRHFITPVNIFYSIHRGEFTDLFSFHNFVAILIEILILLPIALLAHWYAKRRLSKQAVTHFSARKDEIAS